MPKNKKGNKLWTRNNLFDNFFIVVSVACILLGISIWAISRINNNGIRTSLSSNTESKQFPVDKLDLKNVSWKNNIFQGEILNKDEKPTFDVQITIKVSKSHAAWEVNEEHNFTVPYKIEPGETIKFNESIVSNNNDPWSSAYIVSAKYYNGENVPTLPPTTTDSDPIIDCKFTYLGTMKLRKSVCSKSTDCQIGGKWVYYDSVDRCKADQQALNNSNLVDCLIAGKTYRITKDLCAKNTGGSLNTSYTSPYYSCRLCYHYTSGDSCSTYNYLVKSKSECDVEQSKIDSLGSAYVIPTNSSTQTTTTSDSTKVCYDQYNSDIQAARTWGGNVGSAMTDMANSNLSRCLQTGNVTAVGPVQQDTRPRDRDGKLCSEYPPELLSYSQSMGCP